MADADDLDQELRKRFAALRAGAGACPSTERLSQFLSGELEAEESEAIRAHVESCAVCDLLVERMKPFDWPEADSRLTSRFDEFLKGQTPRSRVLSFLRSPVLAYVVILVLLYPAWLGIRQKKQIVSQVAVPRPALESARVITLDATRGAEHVAASIPAGDKVFILSFFIPIRSGLTYSAAILDARGNTVAAQAQLASFDGKGNFYLVCDRQVFTGGDYTLAVSESGGSGRVFRFPFSL